MNSPNSSPESQPDDEPHSPGKFLLWMFRQAYRVAIVVIGFTVLAIGLAMTVLPGPAFIVIPIGLGILAQEFVWARRWLDYAKHQLQEFGITAKTDDPNREAPENR